MYSIIMYFIINQNAMLVVFQFYLCHHKVTNLQKLSSLNVHPLFMALKDMRLTDMHRRVIAIAALLSL